MGEDPAAAGQVTLVDAGGRRHAFTTPPERIVSLVPSATAVLLALGVGERLVARTDFDTARALNPEIRVLVRAKSEDEAARLEREGGTQAFVGELELARAMLRETLAAPAEETTATRPAGARQ